MRFSLTDSVVEHLRKIQREQAHKGVADSIVIDYNAVLVSSFLSSFYLTLDGQILELDHLEENSVPMVLDDPMGVWRILRVASRSLKCPDLLDLHPKRSDPSIDCECDPTGWLTLRPKQGGRGEPGIQGWTICPLCHGLGWLNN